MVSGMRCGTPKNGCGTPLTVSRPPWRLCKPTCGVVVPDENMHGIDGEAPLPSYRREGTPSVGACGRPFEVTETAKQGCATLRATRLISACKTRVRYTQLLEDFEMHLRCSPLYELFRRVCEA
jgi:hypothetical protein